MQTVREMSGEISTLSHLSDVISTDQGDATGENGVTSASSRGAAMYFEILVVVIGVIGTAANGLVLYALHGGLEGTQETRADCQPECA